MDNFFEKLPILSIPVGVCIDERYKRFYNIIDNFDLNVEACNESLGKVKSPYIFERTMTDELFSLLRKIIPESILFGRVSFSEENRWYLVEIEMGRRRVFRKLIYELNVEQSIVPMLEVVVRELRRDWFEKGKAESYERRSSDA